MFQLPGDGKEKKPSYNSPFDTPIKPAAALRNQGRRFSLPSAGSAAHGGSRHADILSRDYELEQTNLTNLVEYLRQEVKEQDFIGAFDFEDAREQSQAAQKEKKTGVA